MIKISIFCAMQNHGYVNLHSSFVFPLSFLCLCEVFFMFFFLFSANCGTSSFPDAEHQTRKLALGERISTMICLRV